MLPKTFNQHTSFHGSCLRSRGLDGFVLSETACRSGLQLERHSHEQAGFCVVLQGGFVEYRDREERLYQPSDILFRPPGEMHANRFLQTGGRCLNIEITEESLQRLGSKAGAFSCPADYQHGQLSTIAMRIYGELEQTDSLTALALEALIMELLIESARQTQTLSRPPSWLKKVKELLHDRFAESVALTEIAATVDVHPAHLARTFRRFERQTVGDYVRNLRVGFARSRLSSSHESIAAIALAAGYYDQCHLSREFKQHTGMTPTEYRTTFRTR